MSLILLTSGTTKPPKQITHSWDYINQCVRRSIEEIGLTSTDIVLDVFAGSFTTAIAAQKLGRIGVGFELRKDLFRECIIKNITNNECQLEEIE